ncbi:MAG TPA: hypothetical protein VKF36_24170 [Syntrophorhabdales bacterium]|nr:hypothetical protein [Syntrophorhabdales bacterium]
MKRIVLLMLSCLFFYSLFRDMNLVKTLLLCAAVAVAFVVSKAPSKYIIGAKYPLICLCFALSVVLVLYPGLRMNSIIRFAGIFLTFFSLSLYVALISEKGKGFYKEVLALSLLFISASLNLILIRSVEIFLPLSITILLFLFILQRTKLLPLAGAFLVVMVICLYLKRMTIYGSSLELPGVERYLILATTFLLLLVTFIGFVRKAGSTWTIGFFGLLYASIDILMSLGFSLKGLLLYQPIAALLILAPLMGVALQGEKGS